MSNAASTLSASADSSGAIPVDRDPLDQAASTADQTQFISFAIGNEQYGVDIMAVREIKGWTEITHLPNQPDYVRGVLNLRGVVLPVIDLRFRFGQGQTEATPLHVMIIVQDGPKFVGLLVDRVSDIISLDASQVKPVPKIAQAARSQFLSGIVTIDGAMIALIDLPNLLFLSGGEAAGTADANQNLASAA